MPDYTPLNLFDFPNPPDRALLDYDTVMERLVKGGSAIAWSIRQTFGHDAIIYCHKGKEKAIIDPFSKEDITNLPRRFRGKAIYAYKDGESPT